MKLVYEIPNKLYYIQNFLDYSTYKKLHYDVFKSKLINLNSTEKQWHNDLTYGFKNFVKNTSVITDYKPLQKIKILLENNKFHKVKIGKYIPVIHSMSDQSGINWHDDTGYKYGVTYYLNHRWNYKFGGELLFQYENGNGFIPIVGNSIIIIKSPLEHKVIPVMKPLIPRKTIQIFVDNYEE
jgi:Rps23 Pro-64 3,4-dihydroxylase Tpa1-like proline 4-hydroxylase